MKLCSSISEDTGLRAMCLCASYLMGDTFCGCSGTDALERAPDDIDVAEELDATTPAAEVVELPAVHVGRCL